MVVGTLPGGGESFPRRPSALPGDFRFRLFSECCDRLTNAPEVGGYGIRCTWRRGGVTFDLCTFNIDIFVVLA